VTKVVLNCKSSRTNTKFHKVSRAASRHFCQKRHLALQAKASPLAPSTQRFSILKCLHQRTPEELLRTLSSRNITRRASHLSRYFSVPRYSSWTQHLHFFRCTDKPIFPASRPLALKSRDHGEGPHFVALIEMVMMSITLASETIKLPWERFELIFWSLKCCLATTTLYWPIKDSELLPQSFAWLLLRVLSKPLATETVRRKPCKVSACQSTLQNRSKFWSHRSIVVE
jgi:hypothetical protein